eukprot:5969233-Pleurochrysis_carterae.AAC.5
MYKLYLLMIRRADTFCSNTSSYITLPFLRTDSDLATSSREAHALHSLKRLGWAGGHDRTRAWLSSANGAGR